MTGNDGESFGIGVDMGGTRIKAALIGLYSGRIYEQRMEPTRDGERVGELPAWADAIRRIVSSLTELAPGPIERIGLSIPGLAKNDGSCIWHMPGRLHGLENLEWRKLLGRKDVMVLNDAHAALLGELWMGAARGLRDVAMLTLGTGVGGAAVIGGQLLRGAIGRAGHFGHISLNESHDQSSLSIARTPGSLEEAIGNSSLRHRSQGRFTQTSELIEAYQAGDQVALRIWHESVEALARGLVSLINVLDPEVILLGGGIANAGDILFQPLEEMMSCYEWRPSGHRVRIRPAELGDWAGCFGALTGG